MTSLSGSGNTSDPNPDGKRRRPPVGAAVGAAGPRGGALRGLGLEKKHKNVSDTNTSPGMPALLDTSEIAGMLAVTERHVRRLVLERRIPFTKVGRFVRFDPRDIEQWVQAAKVPSNTALRHDVRTRREGRS
jgi:excisionase family DNA binding protein